MKIEFFKVKGYKRLSLSSIDEMSIDFNLPLQIILGKNGAGKSSILRLLTLKAFSLNEFFPGGYVFYKVTGNNNKEYQIRADYQEKEAVFSFKVDSKELNDGGTITAQKKLLEEHFNLTDKFISYLLGEIKFTSMSPRERQELITTLSEQDYTYAFKLYNKIASMERDEKGTMKSIGKRLTSEYSSVKDDSIGEELEAKIKALTPVLNELMLSYSKDTTNVSSLKSKLHEIYDSMLSQRRKLFELKRKLFTVSESRLENNILKKARLEKDIEYTNLELNRLHSEYSDMKKSIGDVNFDDLSRLGFFKEELAKIDSVLKSLRENSSLESIYKIDVKSIPQSDSIISNKKMEILSKLSELPVNSANKMNFTYRDSIVSKLNDKVEQVRSILSTISSKKDRLDIITNTKETNCPACKHNFKDGVHIHEDELIRADLEALDKSRQLLVGEGKSLREELEVVNDYMRVLGNFNRAVDDQQYLNPLVDEILKDMLLYNDPGSCVVIVEEFFKELSRVKYKASLEEQKKELVRKVDFLSLSDISKVKEKLSKLENDIEVKTHDVLPNLKNELSFINFEIAHLREYIKTTDELYANFNHFNELGLALQKSFESGLCFATITALQSELAVAHTELEKRKGIQNSINELKKFLESTEKRFKAFSALTNALSPKGGIIGDQMLLSITKILERVNDVINSVYTYDMTILPLDKDLNFKFPVIIDGIENRIGDVSDCSAGQSEMIDFAFLIVSLSLLKLQSPLYLDEFGRRQDEEHLTRLINFINSLVDNKTFSQVIAISHIVSFHGSNTKANFLVLSRDNITLPLEYNKNVSIR